MSTRLAGNWAKFYFSVTHLQGNIFLKSGCKLESYMRNVLATNRFFFRFASWKKNWLFNTVISFLRPSLSVSAFCSHSSSGWLPLRLCLPFDSFRTQTTIWSTRGHWRKTRWRYSIDSRSLIDLQWTTYNVGWWVDRILDPVVLFQSLAWFYCLVFLSKELDSPSASFHPGV